MIDEARITIEVRASDAKVLLTFLPLVEGRAGEALATELHPGARLELAGMRLAVERVVAAFDAALNDAHQPAGSEPTAGG